MKISKNKKVRYHFVSIGSAVAMVGAMTSCDGKAPGLTPNWKMCSRLWPALWAINQSVYRSF